jgi:hypothetical protein
MFIDAREEAGLDPRKGWSSVYSQQRWDQMARRPTRQVPVDTPAVGRD